MLQTRLLDVPLTTGEDSVKDSQLVREDALLEATNVQYRGEALWERPGLIEDDTFLSPLPGNTGAGILLQAPGREVFNLKQRIGVRQSTGSYTASPILPASLRTMGEIPLEQRPWTINQFQWPDSNPGKRDLTPVSGFGGSAVVGTNVVTAAVFAGEIVCRISSLDGIPRHTLRVNVGTIPGIGQVVRVLPRNSTSAYVVVSYPLTGTGGSGTPAEIARINRYRDILADYIVYVLDVAAVTLTQASALAGQHGTAILDGTNLRFVRVVGDKQQLELTTSAGPAGPINLQCIVDTVSGDDYYLYWGGFANPALAGYENYVYAIIGDGVPASTYTLKVWGVTGASSTELYSTTVAQPRSTWAAYDPDGLWAGIGVSSLSGSYVFTFQRGFPAFNKIQASSKYLWAGGGFFSGNELYGVAIDNTAPGFGTHAVLRLLDRDGLVREDLVALYGAGEGAYTFNNITSFPATTDAWLQAGTCFYQSNINLSVESRQRMAVPYTRLVEGAGVNQPGGRNINDYSYLGPVGGKTAVAALVLDFLDSPPLWATGAGEGGHRQALLTDVIWPSPGIPDVLEAASDETLGKWEGDPVEVSVIQALRKVDSRGRDVRSYSPPVTSRGVSLAGLVSVPIYTSHVPADTYINTVTGRADVEWYISVNGSPFISFQPYRLESHDSSRRYFGPLSLKDDKAVKLADVATADALYLDPIESTISACTYGGQWAGVPSAHRNKVRLGRPVASGALHQSQGLDITYPEDLEAIVEYGYRLLAFSKTSIYAVAGDPPGANGAGGSLTRPAKLHATLGVYGPGAVCVTPAGVMIANPQGFYMLGNGDQVVRLNSKDPPSMVIGMSCDPKYDVVYVTTNSGILLYNYRQQSWTKWVVPRQIRGLVADNSVLRGITDNGLISTAAVNYDRIRIGPSLQNVTFAKTVQSGWITPGHIEGFQRVRRATFLGQMTGGADVAVTEFTEYDAVAGTTHNFTGNTSNVHTYETHVKQQKSASFSFRIQSESTTFRVKGVTLEIGVKSQLNKHTKAQGKA